MAQAESVYGPVLQCSQSAEPGVPLPTHCWAGPHRAVSELNTTHWHHGVKLVKRKKAQAHEPENRLTNRASWSTDTWYITNFEQCPPVSNVVWFYLPFFGAR